MDPEIWREWERRSRTEKSELVWRWVVHEDAEGRRMRMRVKSEEVEDIGVGEGSGVDYWFS